MAVTGAWMDAQAVRAGAWQWGTGVKPIHAVWGGSGRDQVDPKLLLTSGDQGSVIPMQLTDPVLHPEYGYTDEEISSQLWGYGHDTGLADRPSLGMDSDMTGGIVPEGYPSWGPEPVGPLPGGTIIRTVNKGADAGTITKLNPSEPAAEGWLNKSHDGEDDAKTSDPAQYEMQTSMRQRHQVQAGSQRGLGSDSTQTAPIQSRVPGQKVKWWPGGERHYDMTPREQNEIIRPFWMRSAGTGYREWMQPNSMYSTEPLQRVAPPDAYQGPEVPYSGNEYGYQGEDQSYVY